MKQGIRCTAVAVCDCACGRIYASSFWVVATVTGNRPRLMYSARRHDETGLQSHRSRTTAQWLAGRTVRGTATAPRTSAPLPIPNTIIKPLTNTNSVLNLLLLVSIDGTDRTDRQTDARPCSTCYAGSVNNQGADVRDGGFGGAGVR